VGLQYEDLRFTEDGLILTVRESKTDQEKEGQTVGRFRCELSQGTGGGYTGAVAQLNIGLCRDAE